MKIKTYIALICLPLTFKGTLWAQNQPPCLKVEGDLQKSLTLYPSDLLAMKRTSVPLKEFSGLQYAYSGVSLLDILKQAGMYYNSESRNEDLSWYVLAISGDGSEALFSAAELDSTFSGRSIILADKINDKPLPEGLGPFRLVVDGEENRLRWLWEVNRLIVRYVKE